MVLPFNMPIMEFLSDHRTAALTSCFRSISDLGEVQGYILIATFIYVMFDKTLAVRLSILVTLTMGLNHILKIIIRNPRPFIREGTYLKKWAVSPDYVRDLATEYSTPSGHAMAAASFYSYLYSCVRNRYVKIVAVLAVLLIGLSCPYLGVHYVEDILLGWAIGARRRTGRSAICRRDRRRLGTLLIRSTDRDRRHHKSALVAGNDCNQRVAH